MPNKRLQKINLHNRIICFYICIDKKKIMGIGLRKVRQKEGEPQKTWLDVFKKYNPEITEKEIDYILWNETCYPFDDVTTIKQIEEYYNSEK